VSEDSPEVLERVNEGLPLVELIAKRVTRTMGLTAEMDEAIASGREGLLRAAREYDPKLNDSFRNFAKGPIEFQMIEGLRKLCGLPRRAHEHFTADERSPAAKDSVRLRDRIVAGMTTAQAEGVVGQRALDTQGEVVALSLKTTPEQASLRGQNRALIERAIRGLPDDEAAVIRRRDLEGEPIKRIAEQLGLPRETIRDLHARARKRLKRELAKLR
jgi:RNA polymerase sigma factor FliA